NRLHRGGECDVIHLLRVWMQRFISGNHTLQLIDQMGGKFNQPPKQSGCMVQRNYLHSVRANDKKCDGGDRYPAAAAAAEGQFNVGLFPGFKGSSRLAFVRPGTDGKLAAAGSKAKADLTHWQN